MKLTDFIGSNFKLMKCKYINWKDETEVRKINPIEIRFGTCEPYHQTPTWLMYAYDVNKGKYREFDMSKMTDCEEVDE